MDSLPCFGFRLSERVPLDWDELCWIVDDLPRGPWGLGKSTLGAAFALKKSDGAPPLRSHWQKWTVELSGADAMLPVHFSVLLVD